MSSRLLETTQAGQMRVDHENAIIRNCLILGPRSRNPVPHNNVYPPSTRAAALPMIDGLAVGINHPEPGKRQTVRPYQDFNGCLRSPHDTAAGVRANWHLNKAHPLTAQILHDAEHNSRNLAFSINAEAGSKRQTPDGMVVEGIREFHSCDLVTKGATTNGLFESYTTGRRIMRRKTFASLIEALGRTRRRKAAGRILRETLRSVSISEAAEAGMTTPVDDQAEDYEPELLDDQEGGDDALKDAFRSAIVAVVDDDSLDDAAIVAKIRTILAAKRKCLDAAGGGSTAGGYSDDGTATTEESRRRRIGAARGRFALVESFTPEERAERIRKIRSIR